ncbi:DUF4376 domain-containing protein [Azospirillaceae bacterium]
MPEIIHICPPFDPATHKALDAWDETRDGELLIRTQRVAAKTADDLAAELAAEKAGVKARVNALRRQRVEDGIEVAGTRLRADGDTRANLTGALALFAADPTLTAIDWEIQPGQWLAVDPAALQALGVAVGRHVQGCFSRARALHAAIDAASDPAALRAIDLAAGWPG